MKDGRCDELLTPFPGDNKENSVNMMQDEGVDGLRPRKEGCIFKYSKSLHFVATLPNSKLSEYVVDWHETDLRLTIHDMIRVEIKYSF